ncbi:MAG: hypothetical protein HQK60_11195 [Deltaproteobacteria bacterium]|nr:hypothetical protein [Deltaproteobacteria bacterium]
MKRLMLFVLLLAVMIMPCSLFAEEGQVTTTVTKTEAAGTVSEFSPDSMVIRTETSSSPVQYKRTKTTTYVDDTGAPVAVETVKSGLPVTVYYTREGDHMIANKVVICKTTKTTTETRE